MKGIYSILFVIFSQFYISLSVQAAEPPLEVSGLEQPAEVLIDRWGVPHIYAGTLYDAFFVQGFSVARDRLWQIDLWRKRGLGEMARDFGPAYVDGDAMARAVLFRGDLYREWLSYGSDAKRVAEAFVAGINAYVDHVGQNPELLPEEFHILDYKPAHWQAEDLIRIRHHGLTLNFTGEVDRAALYCQAAPDGARADWLRRELVPTINTVVPEGLDPCIVPAAEIKRAYRLATQPPQFPKKIWKTSSNDNLPENDPYASTSDDQARSLSGSNNWVISGKKTASGRPILANDPHRIHGAPSLRYISHLNAPGINVIGAGEPFLPGISIGHNETIGFGLTRFYIDQEDAYFYETNPENPEEYRYRDRWEPMDILVEKIEVKGAPAREVRLAFTRHGPVLYEDKANRRIWVLRAAWLDEGMAPYFGSMEYMRASNWDQFRAAMNRWGAPGENQVYADTDGNIGWIPGGLTPIRPNWDGLMPVPGDGRYEWNGYRNMDELPFAYNPEAGYIATANQNTIPPEHPAFKKGIGYEWNDTTRARRLQSLLSKSSPFSVADSLAWQNDTVSSEALRLLGLLHGLRSPDQRTQQALTLLQQWDGNIRADSAATAIFEVWLSEPLPLATIGAVLPESQASLIAAGSREHVIEILENPQQWMKPQQRDGILLHSLEQALDILDERLGSDMNLWRWGQLHVAEFIHPLSAIVDDTMKRRLDVGNWPMNGDDATLMMAWYGEKDFHLAGGASFRMVLDVGNWDSSMAINVPGQSGDLDSPHYRDLVSLWLKGEYFPLLYSRAAVEAATETRFSLKPR